MSNELAKLKVTLEAQTSAYKKEMKEAKAVTKQVSDSIKTETSKIKHSVNSGDVTEPVKKQLSVMQKLKRSLTAFQLKSGIKAPTEDYMKAVQDIRTYRQAISNTEKTLGKYYEKRDKMEALGVNKESRAWKSLEYDIKNAEAQLQRYKEQRAAAMSEKTQMVSNGTAFARPYSIPKEILKGVRNGTAGIGRATIGLGSMGVNAAQKGWGGLKKVISGTASVLTKVTTVIKRTSGAFAALIQKFTNGIPILRRFTSATKSTSGGLGGGLKNILKYAFGIRSLFALVNKLRSALVDGFKNLSQYSGETNNSISMLMSSLTQLKNAFAAAFAPILNVVAPILNSIIQKIISVVNAFGQLTSALTGKTTYIKARKVQQDYAKSLNSNANSAKNAKKANEELQRTILSFDQINKMDDNSSSDSDNGIADTGGLSPSDMFETGNIPSKIKGIADRIKQAWKNADFTDIGALVGNKLNSALNGIPWDKIKNTCNKIAKSVATFLNGFLETVDWKLVGNTLAQGINTAFDMANTFAENFHWDSLGKAIGNGINGALGGLDWNLIQETVRNIATGITDTLNSFIQTTDWTLAGQSFGNGVNTVLDFFHTGVNNFDWIGTGKALSDFANGTIESVNYEKAGDTFSSGIKGILDTGITAIETTNWDEFGEKVSEGLESVDWTGIVERVARIIGDLIGGLAAFLGGLLSDAISSAKDYFEEKAVESGMGIVGGILKGIVDGMLGIGVWIINHVFKPIIDGFKNAFGIHSPSTVMAEQGGYIVSGLLKGVKDNIGKFLNYIGEIPGKVLKSIGNIKNKVLSKGSDIISGLREGFTDKVSSFTDLFGTLPDTIRNAVPNLFDVGAGIIQNFADGFSSIHIPMPHIGWDWSGGNINIGNWSFSLPRFNLQWYAQGGFPEAGQLFMANEAGPELVGKMGNRNAVANNNQIVEGIKAGVFEAVLDALNASGILDRDDSEKEVVLELTVKTDSETLYKAVRKGKRKYDHRYAVTELI